jgi:hypothetical protein
MDPGDLAFSPRVSLPDSKGFSEKRDNLGPTLVVFTQLAIYDHDMSATIVF